jgi:alpha-acetolactate decarboxylase
MRYHTAAFFLTLSSILTIGCTATQPVVTQFSEMREVMRKGQTESRISMADAVDRPHAFGVGALEGLDGEITIVDGDVWVSRTIENKLQVTGPDLVEEDQATLLTLAQVSQWEIVTIEKAMEGSSVESLIERTAAAQGIDTAVPFPFMIEGQLNGVDLHVINGYCPIATDPATQEAKPWEWSSPQPIDAVIVGFFAPDAGGVMTHHGTSIHAHAVLMKEGRTITGHIDQISVTPAMTLRLPKVQ